MVTEENPEDSSKFVFPEDVLSLANNPTFLRVGHKKNISAAVYSEYVLRSKPFSSVLWTAHLKTLEVNSLSCVA